VYFTNKFWPVLGSCIRESEGTYFPQYESLMSSSLTNSQTLCPFASEGILQHYIWFYDSSTADFATIAFF